MSFTNLHVDLASVTGVLPVASGGTNSSTALSSNRFAITSSGKVVEASAVTAISAVVTDSNGLPTASAITAAQLLSLPYWTKYTVTHTQLQTAGTTNNITLFTVPAKTLIHKVVIKQSTAFAGTLIVSYTLSVGITGTLAKYIAAYDVFAAVASSTFGVSAATILETIEDFSSGVAIKVAAISAGGNLNASTAGSADIWVQTSLLP